MPGQIIGLRVWYGDGSIREVRTEAGDPSALGAAWQSWPGTNVQYVAVYMDATYEIWKQDGYDEQGRPINQRRETEHYVDSFSGAEFYFFDPGAAAFGAANRSQDVPRNAVTKRAAAISDAAWAALYTAAKESRRAPD